MPRRTRHSFLTPLAATVIAKALSDELYPDYEPSRTAFVLQGAEGQALLESALALPRHNYYKGTLRKAAALLRSLIKNHPFIDGNKRFALAVTTLFLGSNGHLLLSPKEETVRFALSVAHESDFSLYRVERWLRRFCLYVRRESLAEKKLEGMAAEYPGGLPALRKAMREYGELVEALDTQLNILEK